MDGHDEIIRVCFCHLATETTKAREKKRRDLTKYKRNIGSNIGRVKEILNSHEDGNSTRRLQNRYHHIRMERYALPT